MSGGQLVRAAYRMSVPMDIKAVAEEDDSTSFEDVPKLIKPMLFPMTASVSAIGVEYGLYQGRFWLPRVQSAEGKVRAGMMHIPFKVEEKFRYASVNGDASDSLPPAGLVESSRRRTLPWSARPIDRSREMTVSSLEVSSRALSNSPRVRSGSTLAQAARFLAPVRISVT